MTTQRGFGESGKCSESGNNVCYSLGIMGFMRGQRVTEYNGVYEGSKSNSLEG